MTSKKVQASSFFFLFPLFHPSGRFPPILGSVHRPGALFVCSYDLVVSFQTRPQNFCSESFAVSRVFQELHESAQVLSSCFTVKLLATIQQSSDQLLGKGHPLLPPWLCRHTVYFWPKKMSSMRRILATILGAIFRFLKTKSDKTFGPWTGH